ncbi:uncharacterized protein LOC131638367 [Vicia villosa]|uniref:uncharacterized protein LOC131638367 n=1 Tax=Vicia villosa TaxID=3911 RepID=UPI00273CC19C|nr:uncharacterized protein LOC131638367 [Vicia villosa]
MFRYNIASSLFYRNNLTFTTRSPFSSSSSSSKNHAFTVNYLIQNLSFSPQTASKISTKLLLHNSQNPDSVLALFKSHGFSNSQLSTIIKTCPILLTYDPNKTILPKLNFLLQKGASTSDLIDIITKNPRFLYLSLQNSITPFYDLVKRFLLSDQSTIASIKINPCFISSKTLSHNIQFLLQNGVPDSKVVSFLLRNWNNLLTQNPSLFKKVVVEVMELGFNPKTTFFTVALRAKIMKPIWETKIHVYKKWGWSEENIGSAFVMYPWCMLASVDNIEASMNFFVNHMGWDSRVLAKNPILLLLSLEKRVIPRAFVLKFLESKGLIKDAKLAAPFRVSEDLFLKRYVNRFKEESCQLLELYQEKKGVSNKTLRQKYGKRHKLSPQP